MRVQVVMNGLVSYRGCDEADIKGDAEIFGGLRHDSAGGELVNLLMPISKNLGSTVRF